LAVDFVAVGAVSLTSVALVESEDVDESMEVQLARAVATRRSGSRCMGMRAWLELRECSGGAFELDSLIRKRLNAPAQAACVLALRSCAFRKCAR
jgi:hypothetical protein